MWQRLLSPGADSAATVVAGSAIEDGVPTPLVAASPELTWLINDYAAHCRTLQVMPHPGVMTFLRLHLAELQPNAYKAEREGKTILFTDADMFAFCEFVLRAKQPCPIFEHWRSIDASSCSIGVTGVQMLMRVLQLPGCRVHAISLANQNIGPDGASELVEAMRATQRISHVRLNGAFIHDDGGRHFARLLAESSEPVQQLDELDLSVNMLSYHVVRELELVKPQELRLVLSGNRVLDEVLNASSHAVGVILVIIGAVFLGVELAHHTDHGVGPDGAPLDNRVYVASNVIYLVALFCLYLFSTLYHALFALGDRVVGLFAIFDHSAIYLLIAGSYTPFLAILFPDQPIFSVYLLSFLWLCGIGGIILNLCYHGPMKVGMQVTSYIGMGWCAAPPRRRTPLPRPAAARRRTTPHDAARRPTPRRAPRRARIRSSSERTIAARCPCLAGSQGGAALLRRHVEPAALQRGALPPGRRRRELHRRRDLVHQGRALVRRARPHDLAPLGARRLDDALLLRALVPGPVPF